MARPGLLATGTLLLLLIGASPVAAADSPPAAPAAGLGLDPIVLPGFAPVRSRGTRIELGARSYAWDRSFLPVAIESLGRPLTGPMRLVLRLDGSELDLRPDRVTVIESRDDHAVVHAEGEPVPGLRVACTTRVEYDGVAMVSLRIEPRVPVQVDALRFEVEVSRPPSMRMLTFDTSTARAQDRTLRIEPSLRSGFVNVVGLADGDRSFWWFADNAQGWIENGPAVTEVDPIGDRVRLRQHLIGAPWRVGTPFGLAFNFLATPVRELGSAWRAERVTASADPPWDALGRFHLWWVDAFAHKDLPFTTLPRSAAERLPAAEAARYPGLAANRRLLQGYLARGFHRLPYFSAHCLSSLDPALERQRAEWEVAPPFVMRVADPPFAPIETPYLSHRARAYSDYVLSRLDQEIGRLGMTGIYLDQGNVIDSANPAHGAWRDWRGRPRASLDILGTREFLKRLRVVFERHGKPGYVFVHDSNAEIVPALGFATSTVNGEQFRAWLERDDYIGSVPLDQVRTQFSGGQYGIVTTWLPETWAFHGDDPAWDGSPAQERAYRNFMTLALLHDVAVWPAGFPRASYARLIQALDGFGVAQAEFVGYWREASGARTPDPAARVSFYRRAGPRSVLLVIGNLAAEAREVVVELELEALGFAASPPISSRTLPAGRALDVEDGRIRVPVAGRDFELVELAAAPPG